MVSFSGLISVIGRFHRFRDFYFRLLFGTIHPNYNQFQKPGDIGSGLRQLGLPPSILMFTSSQLM